MLRLRTAWLATAVVPMLSLGCADVVGPPDDASRMDVDMDLNVGTDMEVQLILAKGGGSVCISSNGVVRQQLGNSYCYSESDGDRAINIKGRGQFVLAGGGPDAPSTATARDGSGAWAQVDGTATAVNNSYASARGSSQAEAEDDSYASADNHSQARSTNGSSAIARTASTAVAEDGGCAYASGNSVAVAGAGEIVVVISGQRVIDPNPTLYCLFRP